jgi:hypothetical protein
VIDGVTGELQSVTVSEPRTIAIGDRPAIQYEVRGTLEQITAVYLVTCVEGGRIITRFWRGRWRRRPRRICRFSAR